MCAACMWDSTRNKTQKCAQALDILEEIKPKLRAFYLSETLQKIEHNPPKVSVCCCAPCVVC